MAITDNPLNKLAIAVYNAMPTNEADDEWTTVGQLVEFLAQTNPVTRETVRKQLRLLERDGLAESVFGAPDLRRQLWRAIATPAAAADPAEVTPADVAAAGWTDLGFVASGDEEAPAAPGGPVDDPGRQTPTEVPTTPGQAADGPLSTVVGYLESVRPVTEAPQPPVSARCTHPGCGAEIFKAGRSWVHRYPSALLDDHRATTAKKPPRPSRHAVCTHPGCGGEIFGKGRGWTHTGPDQATIDILNDDHRPTTRRQSDTPKTGVCTHPGCGQHLTKEGRSWRHPGPADHRGTVRRSRESTGPKTGMCSVCLEPMRKEGRSWRHIDGVPADGHKATSQHLPSHTFEPGEVRAAALAVLRAEPGREFTPGEVARVIGARNSSAAFALYLLSGMGEVRCTSEAPWRYRAG